MLRAGLLTCRLPSTAAWSLVLSSTRSLHASAPSYSLSNTKTSASSSWTFKTRYPRNNKLKGKGVGGKGAKGNGVKGKPPGKRKQWIAEASKGITGLALPARLRLSPMRPRAPGRDGKNNGDSTGALVASRSGAARDRPAWRAGGAGPYETVGRNGGGRAPANGRMGSPVESRSRWGQPVSTSRFNGLQRKAAVDSLDVPAGSPPSRYQGLERGPAPRVKVSRKDRRAMRDRGARAATGGRRSSGFTAKAETGARVPTGGRAIVAARQLAESQEKTAAIQASRRERAEKFAMDNVDVSPATKKEMMKTVAKVHFKTMPLRLEVLEAVKNALGPDCKPTPAQALGIPASLDPRRERRPILLGAETGSGKTLAYLIPMIQRLREQEAREAEEILTSDDPDGVIDAVIASATSHFVKPESFLVPTEGGASALAVRSRQHPTFSSSKLRKPRRPRAVILVPTRDLITQVAAVAKKLCAHHARLTVLGLQPFVKDLAAMEERIRWQPVDIVVTTPHNLVRLLEGDGRLTLMPDNIGEIVVDEADTIMDDSFRAEMDRLMGKLSQLPQQPLMTWCSATFPASMIKTISQENPDHIRITTPSLHRTVAGLKQHFVRVSGSDTKANLLMDVLSRSGMGGDKRVIVFCKRRETAEWLADYLRGKKIASVGLITARTWQEERDGYVAAFCGSGRDAAGATSEEGSGVHDDVPRRGISAGVDELRVLVATDVASRGLDTTVVDHVINYDFPQTVMEYLHRVGRTARNGAKGRATSFVTKKEMTLALAIERAGKYGAVASTCEKVSSRLKFDRDWVDGCRGATWAHQPSAPLRQVLNGASAQGHPVNLNSAFNPRSPPTMLFTTILALATAAFAASTPEVYNLADTEVKRMSMFNSADYVVDLLNNPTSVEQGKGGKLSRMNVGSLPALAKQGIAMTLIQLEPCGINEPHTHPRASEAIYVISGDDVQIGFIEENGAKVILNELHTGQSTFIPQGAIHFEINMSCKPAVAIAANNNEDPGTLSIPTTFYKLPDGSLKASLGIEDDEELAKLKAAAPGSPGPGIAECRQKCGLDGGSYYGSNLGAKKSEKKRIGWH